MNQMKHIAQSLAFVASLLFLGAAFAAPVSGDAAVEGKDYTRLDTPIPVETGKKVEVVEFFWFRCPHCNQLEPGLEAWAGKMPSHAVLRHVPAVFNQQWLPAAKLFFALQEMGVEDKLHGDVFAAYHKENRNLDDPAQLTDWLKREGVDVAKFMSYYNSFGVQTQSMRSGQAARNAGINGVPAFMVDGKYTTSLSQTFTEDRLFEVLDQLIEKARKERMGKVSSHKAVKKAKVATQ